MRSIRLLKILLVLLLPVLLPFAATAKDRALLVGIDFYELASETPGATNDTKVMQEFLQKQLEFPAGSIKTLLNEQATAANIERGFKSWLINETAPGDRVFFHYSGHGSRAPDQNNDEKDGFDEVLTPYDVRLQEPLLAGQPAVPAKNFISDDQIGEWLAALANRRVVIVIDACHSGTISRGVGGNKKTLASRFLRAKNQPQSRGANQSDVYSPEPKARDLTVIKEDFVENVANGAAIFTAAKSGQEAFPILTASGYVGALTHLIVDKQKNGLLALGKLTASLKSGALELKNKGLLEAGRNGQIQEPEVETISRFDLNSQTMFGGEWQAAPAVALVNPLSNIKLDLRVEGDKQTFKLNDLISLRVNASASGYLYIVVFSENQTAACIFPTRLDQNNRIAAGAHVFPRGKDYEFYASEPAGTDVYAALLTEQPINLTDESSYAWDEVFRRIGLPKFEQTIVLYAQNRGASARPILNNWQAATATVKVTR